MHTLRLAHSTTADGDHRVELTLVEEGRAPFGWLRAATPEQRAHWTLEPRGFAVYWPDLDDGVEVRHLLSLARLG